MTIQEEHELMETTISGNGAHYQTFIPFVKAVGRGEKLKRDLTYEESLEAMRLIVRREATLAQIGGFLIGQRVKGDAVDEILGFTHVLREEVIQQISPRVDDLLDLAVPYDGKVKTAQLAPAVAVTLVAAGVPVVLHGDEGVPTKEGVGPGLVFEALGVPADLEPQKVERMIETTGLGYLAATRFAPAWHALVPIRRQFGLRTVLNTVEKLLNPANAPYQVSGFFHLEYIERLRSTQTGIRTSWIVQGEEGSIEMASARKTRIFGTAPESDMKLEPSMVGLSQQEKVKLPPEGVAHARLNAEVLQGQPGPAFDQTVLTAGVILSLLGVESDIVTGVNRARQILLSGAAQQRLELAKCFR